jgi:hypothetical protein
MNTRSGDMTTRRAATMMCAMIAQQRGPKKGWRGLSDPPALRAGRRRLNMLGAFVVFVGVLPAVAAAEPKVTIKGGVDPNNRQLFSWTVTNGHTSPIVFIHFPQYHGDTFIPPTGWGQEWKNRAMVRGGEDAPGWVQTSVSDAAQGIPPGGSASFEIRIARAGALPRPGTVTVRFADETEVTVGNVEVPSAQSFLERNAMMIGLVAVFAIALLVHLRRRRTRPPAATAAPPPTNGRE